MKPKQKLIVYLDTSDFARLSKPKLTNEEQFVKKYLIEAVDSGKIIIPNSFPLMVEFINENLNKYLDKKKERAKIIKQLCKEYAIQFIPKTDSPNHLNTRGVWSPRLNMDIDSIIKGVSKELSKNPVTKRYAKDLLHHGKRILLAKKHKEIFTLEPSENDSKKDPLISYFISKNYIINFLLKKKTRKEIQKEIEETINDPEFYVNYVHNYDPILNKQIEKFHELSSKIQTMTDTLKKELVKQKENLKNLTEIKNKLLSKNITVDEKTKIRQDYRYLKKKLNTKKMASTYMSKTHKYLPHYFYEVFDIYLHNHLTHPNMQWQLSDAGDIIHSLFIPHSNLWRGDKTFSNLLIQNKIKLKERIVPKLIELPHRIDEKLHQ